MVEPIGYETMWQKFENQVYYSIKESLKDMFRVEWSHEIKGYKPDVIAMLECHGCNYRKDDFPCNVPVYIFDAFCKFKIEKDYFEKKDKQMKKYSKICDSILVMPQGYEQRPYCKSKNGEYHIINFLSLKLILDSIKSESVISDTDDVCGRVPVCNTKGVYENFELRLRSKIDQCPVCKSKVYPVSLIYCSKYNEYYHPDYLDTESIKYTLIPTYAECNGCGDRNLFGYGYDECPFSWIKHVYQCIKCGVFFEPDTNDIIENILDYHLEWMGLPYYQNKQK